MTIQNSIAGRLCVLLAEGKAADRSSSQRKIWAKLFGISEDQTGQIIRRVATLIEAVSIIERQVRDIPDQDHESLLEWLPEVEGAFASFSLDRAWHVFSDKITEATLRALRICAGILSRKYPESSLNFEGLNKLRDEVFEFHAHVVEADLSANLREYILKHLDLIDRAIVESMIMGPCSVEAAIKQTIGEVFLDGAKMYSQCQNSDEGKRLWEMLGRFATMVGVADGVRQLSSLAGRFLP